MKRLYMLMAIMCAMATSAQASPPTLRCAVTGDAIALEDMISAQVLDAQSTDGIVIITGFRTRPDGIVIITGFRDVDTQAAPKGGPERPCRLTTAPGLLPPLSVELMCRPNGAEAFCVLAE